MTDTEGDEMFSSQEIRDWEALIELSSDIITVIDADGVIRYDSPAVERILGFGQRALVGSNAFEHIHPDDRNDIFRIFSALIDAPDQITERVEYRFRHANGSWIWLETIGSNRFDTDVNGFVLNSRDVTERRRRESQLRERIKELDALHQTAQLFVTPTTSFETLLLDLANVLPQWFQVPELTDVRVTYADAEVTSAGFDAALPTLSTEVTTQGDTRLRIEVCVRKDSSGDSEDAFLREEAQLIDTIAKNLAETLERRVHERELELFKRAVEETPHVVMITDATGRIEHVNPAFEHQTGYHRAEAVGSTPAILKSGNQDEDYYTRLWKTITDGEVWADEIINRRKDGSLYFVDLVISPITDDEGTVHHFVAVEADITARRLLEQQLDVLNRILRHNLRNSLNVIEGHLEELEKEKVHPASVESIEAMHDQVSKLLSITSKASTLRRVLRDANWDATECDLSVELRNLQTAINSRHPHVDLRVHVPNGILVRGDQRLIVAIEEAVENAIIHSDRSIPEVAVNVESTERNDTEWVEIVVSDNGPGIPEDQRVTLELGNETPLEHGSGIGLWLINWTIIGFGGELQIDIGAERGTDVIMRLPPRRFD